jgi:pimeloyl-ACP methyl ester carboxylesterase
MYSTKNVRWTRSDPQFWAWSWDQLAQYDVPTILDFVTKTTGQEKVAWIGHSRGTQQQFAALSATPAVADKLSAFVALAPVAYCNHMTSTLLEFLAHWDAVDILRVFGVRDFLPHGSVLDKYLPDLCKLDPNLCDNLMWVFWECVAMSLISLCLFVHVFLFHDYRYLLMGCCDPQNFNQTRMKVYWNHFPAGSSVQGIVHYAQAIKNGGVQYYDWGSAAANRKHYGQPTPPFYDLTKIPTTLPIHLFAGQHDALGDPVDVAALFSVLSQRPGNDPSRLTLVEVPRYTHMDFVWGVHAHTAVYEPVVKILAEL